MSLIFTKAWLWVWLSLVTLNFNRLSDNSS
jgi:hypothetical protein